MSSSTTDKAKLSYSIDSLEKTVEFLEVFKNSSIDSSRCEVVFHSLGFSRIGKMSWEDCEKAAALLSESGLECHFQWDILMVESSFRATCSLFRSLNLDSFKGVRVQDPGALLFLRDEDYQKDIHFITDQGNHNTLGLKRWLDFWPSGIKRLVISPEIPADKIEALQSELAVELEVLAAGSVLLFYTPRQLVTPLYDEGLDDTFEQTLVWGTSEESPHKGFPIVENQHGTFMFNTKEVLIFDEADSIDSLSLKGMIFRADFLLEPLTKEGLREFLKILKPQLMNCVVSADSLKSDWKKFLEDHRSSSATKGFFRTNKTDVLFKKLKSTRLQAELSHFIGEVVDVKKKKHIGIRLSACDEVLKLGEEIELTSPEGNIRLTTLSSMTNAQGDLLLEAHKDQIIFIPHLGGISVKTTVCRKV